MKRLSFLMVPLLMFALVWGAVGCGGEDYSDEFEQLEARIAFLDHKDRLGRRGRKAIGVTRAQKALWGQKGLRAQRAVWGCGARWDRQDLRQSSSQNR